MVKTVLLAYEREQDLAALETHLQTRGLKVVKARNGLEALEIVRRDAPHFLVSDVLLPRMDGFALCRRVKEDPHLQHVPVVLFSMRVEGPKYEAFAAEVGAERFLQRGATLEDLASALDEVGSGSGTMRMPALVPELLDRREQDRRRLADLEHRVRELEALNLQLTAAERVAREKAEREAKARTDFASTQSVRVRELMGRVRDLESTEQQLAGAETQARAAAQASQASAEQIAALETQLAEQSAQARVLEQMPQPCCLTDPEGRLRFANAAFRELLGLEPDRLAGASLAQFEAKAPGDSTIRSVAIAGDGLMTQAGRWRRSDGALLDVELASVITADPPGLRICVVRDVTRQALASAREQQDLKRIAGLLELSQRAHALTEPEIFAHSLDLLQQLTASESAYVFLGLPEATQLELAARRDRQAGAEVLSVLSRWRGTPPEGGALFECLRSQRPVLREAPEGSGALHDAGLPESWRRQLATPILDGGRIVGVLLGADKPDAYDEDDRRHAAHLADGLWKLLRRRRSDAEIVSAMDHMERVMLGAIECLATLAESQDRCKTGRSRRVADLAAGIGTGLGLPGHTVRGLRVMAQVADVGMLQIPRELLWRPGLLTAAEFDLVRTHAERGADSLKRIEFPWPVAEAVRQHHERLDGTGYPRGLRGEEILLEARIVAVADTVEAMLAPRPHRAALSVAACIEELQAQAGRRYDARVVNACVKLLRERENPEPAEPATATEPPAGQRIA